MRVATPWIYSAKFDLTAIIGPPLAITAFVLTFGSRLSRVAETPTWLWVLLVLGVDVAHVYSSLFRTYLDKEEFQKRRKLYLTVPAVCWGAGVAIYALLGPVVFWSVIAYFAIYHFVRQQYGFLMLYRRGKATKGWEYRLDQLAIYLATVYPLVFWHTYPRNFQWFSDFDVIHIPDTWPEYLCRVAYIAVLGTFFAKEAFRWCQTGTINVGKCLLLLATAAAWGTGIIVFNGDLPFTLINILAHGIPYMALIWIYQYRKRTMLAHQENRFLKFFNSNTFRCTYLRSYRLPTPKSWFGIGVFGPWFIPASTSMLMILVPLLTMPQVTHYVLDAYIWRVNAETRGEVRSGIG